MPQAQNGHPVVCQKKAPHLAHQLARQLSRSLKVWAWMNLSLGDLLLQHGGVKEQHLQAVGDQDE